MTTITIGNEKWNVAASHAGYTMEFAIDSNLPDPFDGISPPAIDPNSIEVLDFSQLATKLAHYTILAIREGR